MYCNFCGKENPDKAKYCKFCGKRFTEHIKPIDDFRNFIRINHCKFWVPGNPKVKLLVDDMFVAQFEWKKGFSVDIPLKERPVKIDLKMNGLIKISVFKFNESIDYSKSYNLELKYDRAWGKSKMISFTEMVL